MIKSHLEDFIPSVDWAGWPIEKGSGQGIFVATDFPLRTSEELLAGEHFGSPLA
jgi:hypothetical protein